MPKPGRCLHWCMAAAWARLKRPARHPEHALSSPCDRLLPQLMCALHIASTRPPLQSVFPSTASTAGALGAQEQSGDAHVHTPGFDDAPMFWHALRPGAPRLQRGEGLGGTWLQVVCAGHRWFEKQHNQSSKPVQHNGICLIYTLYCKTGISILPGPTAVYHNI